MTTAPAPSPKATGEQIEAAKSVLIARHWIAGYRSDADHDIEAALNAAFALAASTVPPAPVGEPVAWLFEARREKEVSLKDPIRHWPRGTVSNVQPLYLAAAPVAPDTAGVRTQALEEAALIADEFARPIIPDMTAGQVTQMTGEAVAVAIRALKTKDSVGQAALAGGPLPDPASALRSGPAPLAEARRLLKLYSNLITDEIKPGRGLSLDEDAMLYHIDRWLAEHPEEKP